MVESTKVASRARASLGSSFSTISASPALVSQGDPTTFIENFSPRPEGLYQEGVVKVPKLKKISQVIKEETVNTENKIVEKIGPKIKNLIKKAGKWFLTQQLMYLTLPKSDITD